MEKKQQFVQFEKEGKTQTFLFNKYLHKTVHTVL